MAVTPENLDQGLNRSRLGRAANEDNVFQPTKGLDEEIVREMSRMKGEQDWMLEMRLKSFKHFQRRTMPTWGGDLSEIEFDDIRYHTGPPDNRATTEHESEAVVERNRQHLDRLGVIFCDMDTAVREYPELVKPYFGTIIPMNDNKFSALNTAVWSGGSFIYVPPGVEVDQPLQAYFRPNGEHMGQFERTLIIADEGSKVHYIEGCSAPIYTSDSLNSAVVEIVVKPSAHVTHTTIQNWSNNVFNLVTKRARVEAEAHMEWVDCNIGSRLTMKYPGVWLVGPKATGQVLSVAYAGKAQHQDIGAKMVHVAPETTSKVVSKSICKDGGRATHRGLVRVDGGAYGCKSQVQCDALILDDESTSHNHPHNELGARDAQVGREATVSRVADEQLFYLMSRGLSQEQAIGMVANGFVEPITRTLPMEYAVEWSRLIELKMEGAVG